MNQEEQDLLIAAGGLTTGSVLGGALGKKLAKRGFTKRIAKGEDRRKVKAAEHIIDASKKYKGDQITKKVEEFAKSDAAAKKRMEKLLKRAGRSGKVGGAVAGGLLGTLAALEGAEYIRNKAED